MPDPYDPYEENRDGPADDAWSEPVDPVAPGDAEQGYEPAPPAPAAPPMGYEPAGDEPAGYAQAGGTIRCHACGADLAGAMLGGDCPRCGAPITANYYPGQQTAGMAVTTMILGIVSVTTSPMGFCCGCMTGIGVICGVLAVIFYFPALAAIRDGRAPEGSRKMALAGLICAVLGLVLALGYIAVMVIFVVLQP